MGNGDLPLKSPPKSLIYYCEESQRLLEAFADTVHELMNLHEEQFRAITNGERDCERFDLLIHLANEDKHRAKYNYLKHLESHGCSKNDDIH